MTEEDSGLYTFFITTTYDGYPPILQSRYVNVSVSKCSRYNNNHARLDVLEANISLVALRPMQLGRNLCDCCTYFVNLI